MKPTCQSASSTKRFLPALSLICSLLCTALMAGVLDVQSSLLVSGQTSTEALHVPELDTGFHLLYQLKPEEAHNQFED